jgi:hypothetical protein
MPFSPATENAALNKAGRPRFFAGRHVDQFRHLFSQDYEIRDLLGRIFDRVLSEVCWRWIIFEDRELLLDGSRKSSSGIYKGVQCLAS